MSMLEKTIRHDVLAERAYHVADSSGMVKLDAMENPYNLPEALRLELASHLASTELNRYPAPEAPELEASLRKAVKIPKAAKVIFGNGSDELIDLIIRACCQPGDAVLAPVPTFVMYAVSAKWAHARFVPVDLNPDFSLNLPAVLQAISANEPKVVFLAYPNNPTGQALKEGEILQIIQAASGLVVVDEAYEPFAKSSFMSRVLEFPNVMLIRTLSKLGLASIRLGYGVASPGWIEQINKVRPPYNVNVLTRVAARFALDHWDVLKGQTEELKANRDVLIESLETIGHSTQCGLEVFESDANFVLMRMPKAPEVFESLKKQGVLIKSLNGQHDLLENCLRVTVSHEADNARFLSALRAAILSLGLAVDEATS